VSEIDAHLAAGLARRFGLIRRRSRPRLKSQICDRATPPSPPSPLPRSGEGSATLNLLPSSPWGEGSPLPALSPAVSADRRPCGPCLFGPVVERSNSCARIGGHSRAVEDHRSVGKELSIGKKGTPGFRHRDRIRRAGDNSYGKDADRTTGGPRYLLSSGRI
jgi:hypothetical protein